MMQSKRDWQRGRRKERADAMFLVYWQMGPTRSLDKLAELCSTLGIRTSRNTLGTYSSDFDWQQRLLDMQSKESERQEREVGRIVDQMNQQDASLAQGMKGLVVAGIKYYQDKIKKGAEIRREMGGSGEHFLEMSLNDMANLASRAQHIERLARGQVTSRTEVWVSVASTVVREFVLIFMAVNKIEDPDEREQEFLRLGDEMMKRYFSETVKRSIGSVSLIENGA